MLISELTPRRVADFIRVDYDAPESPKPEADDYEDESEYEAALEEWTKENAGYLDLMEEVQMLMDSAQSYISNRTGRPLEYVRSQDDLTYSFLALVGEEWENRQIRNEKGSYTNEYAMSAIDAHAVNLLPGEAELMEA